MEHVRTLFDFPPLRDGKMPIELRALTHGIPPRKVKENLSRFYDEWRVSGVDAWNHLAESADVFLVGDESSEERGRKFGWWTLPEVIGDRFISRLLGAPHGTCIALQNASQIMFGILSCQELNRPGKRKIVTTDGEFPSALHSIVHEQRRYAHFPVAVQEAISWKSDIVELGERPFDPTSIIERIGDDTALVVLSHVGFVRGERLTNDAVRRIAAKAHLHGALLCLDGYHAIGGDPIDVVAMDIDLYLGGLLKEGCGSSGSCFLYVRSGLELTPSLSGWFADGAPFAFDPVPVPNVEVRRRFLLGTTPIASLYHGIEGLKIMLRVGLDEVGRDILGKVSKMVSAFASAGIPVVSPVERERMSALVVLRISEANRFREFLLQEKGICVDARRNQFIRMAPHIYNSPREIDAAMQEIVAAFISKEYLDYSIEKKAGPVT